MKEGQLLAVLEVPELQEWDADGDVYLPRTDGAGNYVPASEAAPPQLPAAHEAAGADDIPF